MGGKERLGGPGSEGTAMNHMRIIIAMLAVGLLNGSAQAGVYNLDDPLPQHLPPLPYMHDQIQLVIGPLRKAALPPVANRPGPYEVQAAALEQKEARDLTTIDRVNLGACYLRMNRPNDALRVLREADQNHFLVRANLAATYQSLNELGQAVAYEGQALAAWPSIQPGWNSAELGWYRRVEGFYLKLLQFRLAERDANERQYNQPNRPWDKMDLLFEKPRAAGGDYQAQEQPWKLWGDLPPDGYAIVSQLLVWFPNDDRLYWQLGEILNSIGLVPEAVKVFDELSNKNLNGVREFREHRRVLKESVDVASALATLYGNDSAKFHRDFRLLMVEISPPGLLLPPGGGALADATGLAVVMQADASTARTAAPPPRPAAHGWQFDWKQLFVGFAAGLIVAVLGALQWMEWRRRGHTAALVPTLPPQPTEPVVHDAGAFHSGDAPSDRVEGAS
jgi:tetratricopeptide (TPR) repeat protein